MRYTFKVNLDNAAFGDDPAREVARLLREAADKVEDWRFKNKGLGYYSTPLKDIFGNTCGGQGYREGTHKLPVVI